MPRIQYELPTLLTTSVVRGSQQGESHGGVFLVDFATQDVRQVVDWNTGDIDWQGRGWDRGLRGIAFFAGEIYIAASDELFVYDQDFRIQRSFRSTYLKHCHEIFQFNNHLYLTSTGHDSILAFDLERQRFFWALYLSNGPEGPRGTPYDPNGIEGPGGVNGPPATNDLHLNNVFADRSGMYVSGLRTGSLIRIGDHNAVERVVDLPQGVHNARPFENGVLFNDTAADHVRYVGRDGTERRFAIPRFDDSELTHTEFSDGHLARQGFGRGLCVVDGGQFLAAGSSPSTISLYHLDSGERMASVNFSMDIRNAIHGLEVWPYG